jgi:hypothetical protein
MKQPQFLDEAFSHITSHLLTVFIRKHKDYGKDNILDTGEMGIIFRINDKVNRLKNLQLQNKKPQNESIDETWVDIAVYAIIALLYRKGWFQKLNIKE